MVHQCERISAPLDFRLLTGFAGSSNPHNVIAFSAHAPLARLLPAALGRTLASALAAAWWRPCLGALD